MSAFRVLVLCTGNSARSQIAEALLATRGAQRKRGPVHAASAGSRPAPRVNPFAVEVLALHGILWGDRTPKSIDQMATEQFDLVITVCDNARDACPIFPGADVQIHWGLPDPAEEQDPETAREAFEATYRALESRITALLALPLGELSAGELRIAATAIHAASPEPEW
jgi:arsenate reductase